MKERPILFSAPMVRAILEGRKTQTRRAFSDRTKFAFDCAAQIGEVSLFLDQDELGKNDLGYVLDFCPYGKAGDRLWVRETWRGWVCINPPSESRKLGVARYVPAQMECKRLDYKATQAADNEPYRPSIHMPRWASRIQLEIVSVRAERLNDISADDAIAEGIEVDPEPWDQTIAFKNYADSGWIPKWAEHWETAEIESFKSLWESINGEGSWNENPWVWAIEFKRIQEAS